MASGSLTFGGNLSIALGPLGRNGEASGTVNTNGRLAAMYVLSRPALLYSLTSLLNRYSYSKTRGLFGGVSLEGSVIVERQDANAQAYDSPVTAKMLLGGMVDPPEWARPLIKTLEMCTGMPNGRPWINDLSTHGRQYSFDGLGSGGVSPSAGSVPSRTPSRASSFLRKKKKPSEFPPASWGNPSDSGSYFSAQPSREPSASDFGASSASRSGFGTQFYSDYDPTPTFAHNARVHEDSIPALNEDPVVKATERNMHGRSASLYVNPSRRDYTGVSTANTDPDFMGFTNARSPVEEPFSSRQDISLGTARRHTMTIQPKPELTQPLHGGIGRAIALYQFVGQEVSRLRQSG
jgi:SH3 domain-containing YSC84-like protein 1